MTYVTWNKPMLARFIASRNKAVSAGQSSFMFDNNEYDLRYAKYLIEYLQSQFN